MTTVTTSAIADSVGSLLRQAREEAGVTRHAVAVRTKIPERYVALFEENAFDELTEDVYTKIYLKAYGKFLGFDTSTLLDLYRRERMRMTGVSSPSHAAKHPTTSVPASQLVVTPKLIQGAILLLAVLGIAIYFFVGLKKIVAPPSISLVAPPDGMVTTERSVVIEGRTEQEVSLRINGKSVSPDDNGNFRDALDLQEGLNVITIIGAKKYSKEMTVTRRIIVTPKQRPTAAAPADGL